MMMSNGYCRSFKTWDERMLYRLKSDLRNRESYATIKRLYRLALAEPRWWVDVRESLEQQDGGGCLRWAHKD